MNNKVGLVYFQFSEEVRKTYALEFIQFLYESVVTSAIAASPNSALKSHTVSPQRICSVFSQRGREEFGIFFPLVLKNWGVRGAEDLGKAVFLMAEKDCLKLNGTEKLEDFIRAGLHGTI